MIKVIIINYPPKVKYNKILLNNFAKYLNKSQFFAKYLTHTHTDVHIFFSFYSTTLNHECSEQILIATFCLILFL